MPNTTSPINRNWPEFVESLANGSAQAFDELYRMLAPLRFWLLHRVGADSFEDAYHNLIVALVTQIRRGHLQDPTKLFAYARTIAARLEVSHVADLIRARNCAVVTEEVRDRTLDPEKRVIGNQYRQIAERILRALSSRDREVLIRFYLNEESKDRIESDMGLTETQFRLIKSRAKARFTRLCHVRLDQRSKQARVGYDRNPALGLNPHSNIQRSGYLCIG